MMPRSHSLTYDYLLAGSTPSEAEGKYAGKQFYFYARFNYWQFAMNDIGLCSPMLALQVNDTIPSARQEMFRPELLRDFEQTFILVQHPHGGEEFAASYMPEAEIRRLIDQCIDRFEEEA